MDGGWTLVAVALLCAVFVWTFFQLKWNRQKENLERKLQTARRRREPCLKQAEEAVSHFKAEVTHYILLLTHAFSALPQCNKSQRRKKRQGRLLFIFIK